MSTAITRRRSPRSEVLTVLAMLERSGTLSADRVVAEAAARNPGDPLHDYFDWDDRAAAHQHRVNRARELIRSVEVILRVQTVELRAKVYVRDPTKDAHEQGYTSVPRMRADTDRAADTMQEEIARARGCLNRAHRIALSLGRTADAAKIGAALAAIA